MKCVVEPGCHWPSGVPELECSLAESTLGPHPLPAFTALAEDDARTLTTYSLLWRIRCSLLGLNNCSVCLDVRQELQLCRGVALHHRCTAR